MKAWRRRPSSLFELCFCKVSVANKYKFSWLVFVGLGDSIMLRCMNCNDLGNILATQRLLDFHYVKISKSNWYFPNCSPPLWQDFDYKTSMGWIRLICKFHIQNGQTSSNLFTIYSWTLYYQSLPKNDHHSLHFHIICPFFLMINSSLSWKSKGNPQYLRTMTTLAKPTNILPLIKDWIYKSVKYQKPLLQHSKWDWSNPDLV